MKEKLLVKKQAELIEVLEKYASILFEGWNNEENNIQYPIDLDLKIESLKSEISRLT